ncbi:hypothetical protein C818_00112 [Lachnospiraceae bacterium MD308]|nr:hypothetical protein C818_00112 [Lachnospiraceae bacterium MD308]
MISRRNYFAITIVMFIIFFMFLSIGVMTERWNDYETNPYWKDRNMLPGESVSYSVNKDAAKLSGQARDLIVYIGGEKMEEAVGVWASYTKREMKSYTSLELCKSAEWKLDKSVPYMLVIDPDYIRWEEDTELEALEEYLDTGSDVVFCRMPDVSVVKKSRRVQKLFGIRRVREDRSRIKGVHLYDGFLLGGEAVYMAKDKKEAKKRQDMDLILPWYELESGTEAYMKGIVDEEDIESEEYPVIIWKKNYRDSCLMAVNGSYMEEFGGIGILSAMAAQMNAYEIYPIVNAQNMVAANYPVMAQENEERLMDIYSRNMRGVGRDVLWPGIMSVYRRNRLGLTCMVALQLDYEDGLEPEEKQFDYYLKNLNMEGVETGLSGLNISGTPLKEKLDRDYEFAHRLLPDYHAVSFYGGSMGEDEMKAVMYEKAMSSVRTVVSKDRKDNEIIGYLSEHVTKQKVLSDGFTHTYRDDLRIRCVETMLGYTNILLDVTDAVYPEDKRDSWEKLSEDLSWNIQNYWRNFQKFQGTTTAESDIHIRRFLSLDYSQKREGRDIRMQLSETARPVWFILRTHGEAIERMSGGSFTRLENDVFLLEFTEAEAVITMKSTAFAYE